MRALATPRSASLATALAFAALFRPSPAVAQDEGEPIHLLYEAHTSCPDEASFVARIRERTTRARIAWPGEPARSFVIVLAPGPPPIGTVTIRALDGAEGVRTMEGDTCADVANALAMVVALAVDPQAKSPPIPVPTATTIPAPETPPRSKDGAPSPLPPAAPAGLPRAHEAPPTTASQSARFFAGVDAAMAAGVSPNALFGPAPYVGWRARSDTAFQPSLRLSFVRAASGSLDVTGGAARFTWTTGRLDACPVAWRSATVRLEPCARIEAGALEVAGGNIDAARTKLRPWLAAGPVARAEWSLFEPLFLDLDVGLLLRATNDRFYFQPDITVYHVPIAGLDVGIGLGAHFL